MSPQNIIIVRLPFTEPGTVWEDAQDANLLCDPVVPSLDAWWKPSESSEIEVARMDDGRAVILRSYRAPVDMVTGMFVQVQAALAEMAEEIRFVEPDEVTIYEDTLLDDDDPVEFIIKGWVELPEEAYQEAVRLNGEVAAYWDGFRLNG